jgi:hypothetical protein
MSIEAMKQALEALEYIDNNYMSLPKVGNEAIHALRTAIEQAEKQEPVIECDCTTKISPCGKKQTYCGSDQMRRAAEEGHAFTATPPAAPVQEPLTDEQIKQAKPVCADFVSFRAGVRYAEARHKERQP